MTTLNFDARTVPPHTEATPIPAGWYNVQIDHSEIKATSSGTGAYLELRFTVIAGDYAGCAVFEKLNLKNENPIAQEIAYRSLSSICHAVGQLTITDSQQLHAIPLRANVRIEPESDKYSATNSIRGYKKIEGVGGAKTVEITDSSVIETEKAPWEQQIEGAKTVEITDSSVIETGKAPWEQL